MDRNYKNTFCAILIGAMLLMSVGYSILSSRLNIEGTSKITSEFNIQITGINEIMKDGLASTANVDFNATSATYSTNIQSPGDIAVYEITVENKGSLYGHAELEGTFLDYVSFSGDILMGVIFVSNEQIDFNDYDDFFNNVDSYLIQNPTSNVILEPGDKVYYYAMVAFNKGATSLPTQKNYSNSIDFTFRQVLKENISLPNEVGKLLLAKNDVVTAGDGLYRDSNNDYYVFKTSKEGNVNNYFLIGDKLWRLISFRPYVQYSYNDSYYLFVEDDDTINPKTVFSSIAGSNGFYNNIFQSTLYGTIMQRYNDENYFDNHQYYGYSGWGKYISDNKIINTGYDESPLLSVELIMDASLEATCTFANLSTGGCQSWLTNNGDTYLVNPIYLSDEITNTGNIAYLEDGKVISVNPTDSNYGYYKMTTQIGQACGETDAFVSNYLTADGSKLNPYIINTSSLHYC